LAQECQPTSYDVTLIKKFEIVVLLITDMGRNCFEKLRYIPFDRKFHGESNGAWRKNASLLVMTSWFIKKLEMVVLLISDMGRNWFEKLILYRWIAYFMANRMVLGARMPTY